MAKRPFNPEALAFWHSDDLRPPMGVGALVWRFTVLVPIAEFRTISGESLLLADAVDFENLQELLVRHFGGVSMLSPQTGTGLRDPGDINSLEVNRHLPVAIYTKPISAADRYFERLQQEMQEAFDQGLVLVERQEVYLLGEYRSPSHKEIVHAGPGQLLK